MILSRLNRQNEVQWGELSITQLSWLRLKQNKLAMGGLFLFIFITILCFVFPLFLPANAYEIQNLNLQAQAPSSEYWFGTDSLGRDLFSRVLYGGRISLSLGFAATMVSLLIGVSYGCLSGYLGGRCDAMMMRTVDVLYALPFTIFVILLMVLFERNIFLMFAAIGAVEWLTMARIVRGQVVYLKNQQYIDASRALGASDIKIMFKHLLPNFLGVVIVFSTLTVPAVMLLEAFLSFIGMGVQPPMSSWGLLIRDGADSMEVSPWRLCFPALFFSLTLFSLNFLGDGLRDAFDPRDGKA
ncbi:MAG: ABC transporter permease [Verrucomicrobiota bacterium]